MTKRTHLSTKNRLSTRAAGSTPIPKHCRKRDRILHRLMYQTGATVSEMTSNQPKGMATQTTDEILTSLQKIAFRHEPPDLRHSKGIATTLVDCDVDWCVIQVQQWVRRGRKNKMWRWPSRQKTHLVTINRLVSQAAGSTPIQAYCRHRRRMRHRLMYDTCATMG